MMMNVLIIVAPTIGIHWSRMIPKQRITPTPAGTKKNPRFLTKKSATLSTDSSRTHPAFSDAARKSMPMIDDGTGTPVSHTVSSPSARNAKRTAH